MKGLLDPKLDYIFKNIFGREENKHLLLSLLNSILKGKPQIESLTLENTEIAKLLEEDKASRLDVRAKTDDGTMIDIEIQCKNTGEIPARAVNYMANMLPKAVKTDESYNKAHVISIWILGENVTDRVNAISEAYMTFQPNHPDDFEKMAENARIFFAENARIFFIELPKFNPKNADMHDLLTAWLEFLKNPMLMDDAFLNISEVKTAMNTLKYISGDDEVRAIADMRQRTISAFNSEKTVAIENARAEGLAEGKAEGLAEGKAEGLEKGREEGKIETAKNLLEMGLSIEQVSQGTGLSIEEIGNFIK